MLAQRTTAGLSTIHSEIEKLQGEPAVCQESPEEA